MTSTQQTVATPHRKLRSGERINSSRWYLEQWITELAASIPAGSRVLDAGAGRCPYRRLFSHVEYQTADFCQVDKEYGQIDFVCNLETIPAASEQYDFVLCTQVFEHLPRPHVVIGELYRLLKPGGKLFASAPLFYEEHEKPYDFFRYTQFGLRHLLEAAGFSVREVECKGAHAMNA